MATIERHVTRSLIALDGGAPCGEAARRMALANVGAIAVLEEGAVVGIVSERELVRRVLADGAAASLPVRRAMIEGLPRVALRASDEDCTAMMRDHGTRHLLVEEGGEVVGIISMRDLIQLMLEEKEWMIGQLRCFIEGRDFPAEAVSAS
jgi:signal-transduction protein with cAMP-binding, CBS, and nucleotidyltransferase domain